MLEQLDTLENHFNYQSVEYIASGSSPRLLFSVQQSQGFADSGKRCAVMLEAKGGWKCAASGCRQECVHVRNAQKVAVETGKVAGRARRRRR